MAFPQCDARVANGARRLLSFSGEDRAADVQAREAEVVESNVLRQVASGCQCQLLVGGLQWGGPIVGQLQCRGVLRELRREIPVCEIDAGSDAGAPGNAEVGIAVDAQAAFAPGAGNDQRLDEVTLHPVEVGRLVMLVNEAKGQQEQTRTQRGPVGQLPVDVKLLDLKLARVLRRGNGVLDLVLGVEFGLTVEAIADSKHRTGEIRRRPARVATLTAVVQLAVAPQAYVVQRAGSKPARLSAWKRIGGRWHTGAGSVRGRRGGLPCPRRGRRLTRQCRGVAGKR